ncbi:acyl-CoA N-acyltransferase [Biscogniauxia marginata]|nr:acyl-CoA N-acyltransferase [Biscogniauxia marginata]
MVASSGPMDFSRSLSPKVTSNAVHHKPTPEIKVDLAQPSDARAIALLGARCFSDTFGYSVPAADLADFLAATYTPGAIEADILDSRQATGESERGVPGDDPAAHAELRRLYVDGGAHGRGIGSRLIAAVEDRARAEGFEQLWLSVWEHNVNAQRMYEKRGYVRVGELDFATGTCIQTDWVLSKPLR